LITVYLCGTFISFLPKVHWSSDHGTRWIIRNPGRNKKEIVKKERERNSKTEGRNSEKKQRTKQKWKRERKMKQGKEDRKVTK
jgi:hypothetical protein